MNKTALVTGADGFIGSHLSEHLLKQGYNVKAFVYYNSWSSWGNLDYCEPDVRQSIEVVTGDIRDFHSVRSAVSGCDLIFHLAALIGIPYSYQSPRSYVDTNIGGTLNVLQAAQELGCEKVVHTSTSEVYGTAMFVPITEDHPLQSQSPYSATKTGADQLALSFLRSFSTPVTVARPFNTYGPRQSPRAVIPTIITQIANGERNLKLGALHPTRDFNFVADTVRGLVAAGESERSIGEVINIGSNFEISIHDTVQLIAQLMNAEITISCDSSRVRPQASEVERLWADNSKAKALLGWEPLYGGLDGLKRGLGETIAWFASEKPHSLEKAVLYHV